MAEYIRQDHHLPHGSLEPHITNGDRLRMMTDEELAEFITARHYTPHCPVPWCEENAENCEQCWLAWLRKEADERRNHPENS